MDPITVRESLMAEVLGDLLVLLDRFETLPPSLDESRVELLEAARRIQSSTAAAQQDLDAMAMAAKRRTVEYLNHAAAQARQQVVDEQVNALRQTARVVIAKELTPAMRELSDELRRLANRSIGLWLAQFAATLVAGGILSLGVAALAMRFLGH